MKIVLFIKNRKAPFLVSLFICLFSNILFAQDELPVENTTYYHATCDGNSYYSYIQIHQEPEKLDDSLDEFYAPLTNTIYYLKGLYNSRIYIILLIIVWSIYRVYRYNTYKKLAAEQQEYKASKLWLENLSPFVIILFLLSGLLVGCDIGFLIHNMLGYSNPEWIDLIIRMVFSIPIGGILGILLGLFITRKTRLA